MADVNSKLFFYKLLVDNFLGSMIVSDNVGKIVFSNNVCNDLLGLSPKKILNKTIHEIMLSDASLSTKFFETNKNDIIYHTLNSDKNIEVHAASKPIFDENDDLNFVLTYSFDKKLFHNLLSQLENEKKCFSETLNFVQDINSCYSSFIAESSSMKSLVLYINRLSNVDSSIIIYGESGVGKTSLAHFIHKTSVRANEVFIPINCASMSEKDIEIKMFGYEGDDFNSSNKDVKIGLFEFADKGTIFFDEISELPFTLQSKLLKIIETRDIKRIGSNKLIHTDAKIIASSSKNLLKMVEDGTFRSDLYYRLSVIPIIIPPLRERVEDIEPLSKLFLEVFNKKLGYKKIITDAVLSQLKNYRWPGNISELKNIIENMIITSSGNTLDYTKYNFDDPKLSIYSNSSTDVDADKSYKEAMHEYEKEYVLKVIESCNGNIAEASKKMKLHISGVYRKLESYKK